MGRGHLTPLYEFSIISPTSVDPTNRNPRHWVPPIPILSHKIPDAVNPRMDMDVALGPRSAGIKSFSGTHRGRAWNIGTQFIVGFAARVVGRRKQGKRLIPSGTLYSIEGKKTVVGGNQHGSHTDVVELTTGCHSDRRRVPGRERSTRVGH